MELLFRVILYLVRIKAHSMQVEQITTNAIIDRLECTLVGSFTVVLRRINHVIPKDQIADRKVEEDNHCCDLC